MQEAITSLPAPGACLRVDQGGVKLHERAYGPYQLATVVPIASATKWLSAAVLMALVDDGRLRLDDRVSSYVATFQRPDKVGITLRQCFAHTSGLPANHPAIADDAITLAQAVDLIATAPMQASPGTEFSYGGVSMHVAGRVCEVVGGRSWAALFQDEVATPLGLTATDYDAFGATQNPRIAGGARSTVLDYARFVDMLRARGVFLGRRVLSAAAVAEMFRDHTSQLPVRNSPHPHGAPYGIGTWIDRRDAQGRTLQAGGAGAFGFSAWVDLERGVSVTFAIVDRYSAVWPYVDRLAALTYDMLKPMGIACVGAPSPACAPASSLNGDRVPVAGSPDFALIAVGAPSNAGGALALAFAADPTGTPVLGVTVHLALSPAPLLLPWSADGAGRARLPLPLAGVALGERAAAQAIWLDLGGCGSGLRAGHAVEVVAQAP